MDLTTALPYINTALLIIGGLGLGEYLRKRAESLATRKDIEDLTRKVEVIKAEISDATWTRQKRWELKRDVLLEAINRLNEFSDALMDLDATARSVEYGGRAETTTESERNKVIDRWKPAQLAFDLTEQLAATTCGKETALAFRELKYTGIDISDFVLSNQWISLELINEFWWKYSAALAAARKELGIEELGIEAHE